MKGDEIVITDQVHFATDKDIILDDSKSTLAEVAQVLVANPEIREMVIEGHTDVRASDAYNMNLSQRRVNSVMHYLTTQEGIDPQRLTAKGYGHSKPVYDDAGCLGPDEGLTPTCRAMTAKNRRVVFKNRPPRGAAAATDHRRARRQLVGAPQQKHGPAQRRRQRRRPPRPARAALAARAPRQRAPRGRHRRGAATGDQGALREGRAAAPGDEQEARRAHRRERDPRAPEKVAPKPKTPKPPPAKAKPPAKAPVTQPPPADPAPQGRPRFESQ